MNLKTCKILLLMGTLAYLPTCFGAEPSLTGPQKQELNEFNGYFAELIPQYGQAVRDNNYELQAQLAQPLKFFTSQILRFAHFDQSFVMQVLKNSGYDLQLVIDVDTALDAMFFHKQPSSAPTVTVESGQAQQVNELIKLARLVRAAEQDLSLYPNSDVAEIFEMYKTNLLNGLKKYAGIYSINLNKAEDHVGISQGERMRWYIAPRQAQATQQPVVAYPGQGVYQQPPVGYQQTGSTVTSTQPMPTATHGYSQPVPVHYPQQQQVPSYQHQQQQFGLGDWTPLQSSGPAPQTRPRRHQGAQADYEPTIVRIGNGPGAWNMPII